MCGFILWGRLSVCSRRTLATSPSVWEEVADGFLIWDVKCRSAGWEAGAWAQFKRAAPLDCGREEAKRTKQRATGQFEEVAEKILDRRN